ncbi:MAG: hypothetical protein JKY54_13130, partial [Flavobacteriales bacterium]|nr:hypothetical protein [Flavobacteriales bacterium]
MKDVKRPKGIFAEGAGGGGSGGSNDANTLFSTDAFEMVLGISEGPIYGLDGTTIAEQLSNLFVDDVPVMSKSGSLNFKDSDFVIRYESGLTLTDKDDPDYGQSPIQYILGGQATPHNVSAELLPQIEIIRNIPSSITGQFDRVEVRLLINQLYKITSKGYKTDFIPITIKWRYVGDANWNTVFQGNISGKTTVGGFVKGYSFAVDDKTRDVEISVMNRDSAGIDEEEHVHKIAWLNYETEKLISEENQEYHPNTAMLHVVALIGNEIQRLPNISGVWKGLLCRVPSNYDPETRTYNEATPWDGSFKLQKAWTDNPFWIAYELITNTEFGLYKYNPRLKVNRYSVYALAKDADEMVEGTNGLTPRYTFNALITEPMLGLELINYIVGTAHARVVDGQNGEIEFLADRNTPSVATITPEICIANSEDVVFNYSFSDIKNRYNEVRTSYVDPDLNWEKQTIGPFIDTQAQSKFGANVDEYDSLGCIYPDEVKRKAYLRLISYQTETMSVSFMMPTNGPVLKVFDIVDIVDPDQNWGLSGRASSYTEDTLKLRDELYFDESGVYDLKIPLKGGGYFEGSIAVGSAGFHSELYLVNSASLPNNLATYTPFTIQKSDAEPGRGKPFRIISMKRDGENVNQVAITAIEVNRSKWDASDNFELVGSPRYNFELPPTPEQPRNVTVLKEEFVSVDNVTAINLWLSWDTPSQVFMGHYYEVSLIKNGVDLGVVVTTDNTIVEVPELSFGEYQIKVTMVYNGVRASSELLPWELRYLSFTDGNYDPNRLELEIEANFLGADLF